MTTTRTEYESADFLKEVLEHIDVTMDDAVQALETGATPDRKAAKSIRKGLRALAERAAAGVDDSLVMDLASALGVTMAHFAVESGEDEQWIDRFAIQCLDDVAATVYSFRGPRLYELTGSAVVGRLRDAGALSLDDISDLEHLGDVLIAAAAAIAHVVVPRTG